MRIKVLDRAEQDLREAFQFYESQRPGLGDYFQSCLASDIESLRHFGGVHHRVYKGYHRALSKRFPFAIFYTVVEKTVFVTRFWTADAIRLGFVGASPPAERWLGRGAIQSGEANKIWGRPVSGPRASRRTPLTLLTHF